MNYLFFFVHPSKFHTFKETINSLKATGHKVDIIISSKDVLEDLIIKEAWEYVNIFPKGRKIKGLHPYLNSSFFFLSTIFKLFKHSFKRKYDLFISDDLLAFVGKLKNVKTISFLDDDIKVVKQFSIILQLSDYVLAPNVTDLGKYSSKKIGFDGYKELAYLHPNVFRPSSEIAKKYVSFDRPYFIIRLVSLMAYHDVGKKGISNDQLFNLISELEKYGNVYISAERELGETFQKYKLKVDSQDLKHVLAFSKIFIGDSQTMSSEASLLGIPCFKCNDFSGQISVMNEKETKYELMFCYKSSEFNLMLKEITSKLKENTFFSSIKENQKRMLMEKIDLSAFMIWLFTNFPNSVNVARENSSFQNRFKTIK